MVFGIHSFAVFMTWEINVSCAFKINMAYLFPNHHSPHKSKKTMMTVVLLDPLMVSLVSGYTFLL